MRSRARPRALAARGIGRGDRVAMLLGNGSVFPVVLFAALRLGAIAVPISIREQAPGLAYMLAHCGAKVLVHDADLADRLPDARAAPALAHRIPVTPGAPCEELALLSGAAMALPSLRGAKRRSNPDSRAAVLDCFAFGSQ